MGQAVEAVEQVMALLGPAPVAAEIVEIIQAVSQMAVSQTAVS